MQANKEPTPARSDFWDIRTMERETLMRRRARVEQLERAVALAEKCMTLRNQPGYQDFVKIVTDLHEAAMNELISCPGDTKVLQGKVQAFRSILNVMRNTENARDTLAGQLKAEQDSLESITGPGDRVIPSTSIWS